MFFFYFIQNDLQLNLAANHVASEHSHGIEPGHVNLTLSPVYTGNDSKKGMNINVKKRKTINTVLQDILHLQLLSSPRAQICSQTYSFGPEKLFKP